MGAFLEIRRWDNIVAIKTEQGNLLGFHSYNLEVAEISENLWQELAEPTNKISDSHSASLLAMKDWNAEQSTETFTEKKQKKVQSLSINVTQVCNLHCVYCAAGGDGTYGRAQRKISISKTLPQLDILLSRLDAGEQFNITFLGGEPLLYPQGMELIAEHAIEIAEQKGISLRFQVITNGTLFNEENIAFLKRYNFNVSISVDGPPQINDVQRPSAGGTGSTAKVLEGLQLLLNNRSKKQMIKVQGVFGSHNTQVFKAYQFYRELGVDSFEFNFDQSSSDENASKHFETEMKQVCQHAYENGGESSLRQIHFFDQLFSQMDEHYRIENFCGSGRSYAVIDANNVVFDCPWSANELSAKIGQGTDFKPEQLQHLKTTSISTNNCQQCWARHLCGGGCAWAHKQATGDKSRPDLIFCNRTRNLISQGILYYYLSRKELT
jgi:uncharacterized protein